MFPLHLQRGACAATAALALSSTLAAQTNPAPAAARPPFELTVASIMRGPLLVGRSPDDVRWSADSRAVWYRWRDPESRDTTTHVYRVSAAGGAPVQVADSAAWREEPGDGRWSADHARRAEERAGDVYVADVSGRTWRITQTPARERDPHLSPDGRTVYFLRDNNLYAVPVDGAGALRQLTDLRLEDAPRADSLKGQRNALSENQRTLFDVVRDRRAEREHAQAVDSARREVRPVWLGKSASVAGALVSPSGRYVLLSVGQKADGSERAVIVPSFVTESGYTETLGDRGKVGETQALTRAAVLDLATGALRWIEPEAKDRRLTMTAVGWAPRSDRALLIGIPADYKDRWIYVAGPDGRATTVDRLRDTAWVGGPGLFSTGWMPDERVWFVSERSGWAHLYTVAPTGGEPVALTSGRWEVRDVQPAADGRTFSVVTSETHPGEQALYTVAASGGARTRVSPAMLPWTDAVVSPDGRWAALLMSDAATPPELYLAPNRPGAPVRRVTTSTTAEFRAGPWIRPQIVEIPTRDGQTAYARIFRPRDLGAQPNGGAVMFVHGAGYLQDADRGWSSSYFREYLFNHLLASRGWTVLDVDYRGSAGYGAAWRTGIYRHMGGSDLDDEVDGARWLVAHEGVDPKRIGMYGGSYGGFMTLMAMFTQPEVFRSGAALRSVTNWANYNHWYTSRILDLPQDDSAAYRRSSPIWFAQGLRGDLLMAHGMMDTNVNFQDIVELTQRLIELRKTHWELAVYPVEDHTFTRPESWTDEYTRILALFDRTLAPGSPPLPGS